MRNRTGINPYAAPTQRPVDVQEARQKVDTVETEVPAGSISEVLQWVGDDTERAELALAHETANHGRKTLVEKLNVLVHGEDEADVDEDEDDDDK